MSLRNSSFRNTKGFPYKNLKYVHNLTWIFVRKLEVFNCYSYKVFVPHKNVYFVVLKK